MHGPQIARVTRIATTHVTSGDLDDQYAASGLGGSDGSTQPGVASADHQHVPQL